MNAMTPVLFNPAFPLPEVNLSEGTDYLPMPALIGRDLHGMRTVRFRLTWQERITLLFGGNLWVQQLTFNSPYPPVKVLVEEPHVEECL